MGFLITCGEMGRTATCWDTKWGPGHAGSRKQVLEFPGLRDGPNPSGVKKNTGLEKNEN